MSELCSSSGDVFDCNNPSDRKQLNSISDVIIEENNSGEYKRRIIDLKQKYQEYMQEFQGIFVLRCQLMYQELLSIYPNMTKFTSQFQNKIFKI